MRINKRRQTAVHQWTPRSVRLVMVMGLLYLITLSSPFTLPALAYDPHFRLPWAPGPVGYQISGFQYHEGDHDEFTDDRGNRYYDYYAIDFGLPLLPSGGAEVRAAQGGYATTATDNRVPSYGRYVIINHGNGYSTVYAHLSEFANINGTNVTQGQLIGYSGDSGTNPPMPHLHFSTRFTDANGVTHSYMPEPMSGYTGFGNLINYRSKVYYSDPQPSNVLKNWDFTDNPVMALAGCENDGSGGGPWNRIGQTGCRLLGGGPSGRYLQMDRGSVPAGGEASVWQDFPVYNNDFSDYTSYRTFVNTPDTWTFRVWMQTPNCSTATGTIAVFSMNGPYGIENGSMGFELNSSWQPYSITSYFTHDQHNRQRVQIYLDTPGCYYNIDYASFHRNYINNSSFEDGGVPCCPDYWTLFHYPECNGNWVRYRDYQSSPIKDRIWFLEANLGNCATGRIVSPYQDVYAYTSTNPQETYTARAWIRAFGVPEDLTVPACRAGLYLMSLPNREDNSDWRYVTSTWQEFATSLIISKPGNNFLHPEIYMVDRGCNYDFDGVQVWGGAGNQ